MKSLIFCSLFSLISAIPVAQFDGMNFGGFGGFGGMDFGNFGGNQGGFGGAPPQNGMDFGGFGGNQGGFGGIPQQNGMDFGNFGGNQGGFGGAPPQNGMNFGNFGGNQGGFGGGAPQQNGMDFGGNGGVPAAAPSAPPAQDAGAQPPAQGMDFGGAPAAAPAASNYQKGSGFNFYSGCKNPNEWAITYDDGPTQFADALLDLLKEKGYPATFFLVGNMYMPSSDPNWARIVKRMDAEGHIVGNHTFDHKDLTTISPDEISGQIKQLEDAVFNAIGKRPAFMRPPYGSGNGNQQVMSALSSLGYTAGITWNIDPMDYSNGGDVNYAKSVCNNATGGVITLNHLQYNGSTQEGLLALINAEIDTLVAKGYKPVSMEQCLGISAYQ